MAEKSSALIPQLTVKCMQADAVSIDFYEMKKESESSFISLFIPLGASIIVANTHIHDK